MVVQSPNCYWVLPKHILKSERRPDTYCRESEGAMEFCEPEVFLISFILILHIFKRLLLFATINFIRIEGFCMLIYLQRADMGASLQRAVRLIPTNSFVFDASDGKFWFVREQFIRWRIAFSISNPLLGDGTSISNSRSNCRGHLNAGSMDSGRFVAVITRIWWFLFTPSIKANNEATICCESSSPPSLLVQEIASNSSINTTEGAESSADLKSVWSACSVSP